MEVVQTRPTLVGVMGRAFVPIDFASHWKNRASLRCLWLAAVIVVAAFRASLADSHMPISPKSTTLTASPPLGLVVVPAAMPEFLLQVH